MILKLAYFNLPKLRSLLFAEIYIPSALAACANSTLLETKKPIFLALHFLLNRIISSSFIFKIIISINYNKFVDFFYIT